jgi:hypothetical protein
MEATLDLEAEARAADALAETLTKVDAPQELIDQARRQAAELRSKAQPQSISSSNEPPATKT